MIKDVNNHTQISSTTLIFTLLELYPQAVPVFLNHRMACVGCSMARFETLGTVAQNYGLALEDFLKELQDHFSIFGGLYD